jgi:DnaJ-class molecular chaperone
MKTERQDFIELRDGEYARALSQCPEPVSVEPDVDIDPCEKCEGEGIVLVRNGQWFMPRKITCPKCEGRGV